MIVIKRRKKNNDEILKDLRKKNPYAPDLDLKKQAEQLEAESFRKIMNDYPGYTIVDLTSKSNYNIGLTKEDDNKPGSIPAYRFSPFYPHGGIPIPGFQDLTATCVEAVWQGLKFLRLRVLTPICSVMPQDETLRGLSDGWDLRKVTCSMGR